MKNFLFFLAFQILSISIFAHTSPDSTAVVKTIKEEVRLPEGTPVSLRFFADLSSDEAVEGRIVPMEVYKDLYIDGKLIFREGAYAECRIIEVEKAGIFGKSGKIVLDIIDVTTTDNVRIPLYCQPIVFEGEHKRGIAFGLSAGIPIVALAMGGPITMGVFISTGLFVKGKQVNIKNKMQITAEIARDTKIVTKRTISQ